MEALEASEWLFALGSGANQGVNATQPASMLTDSLYMVLLGGTSLASYVLGNLQPLKTACRQILPLCCGIKGYLIKVTIKVM